MSLPSANLSKGILRSDGYLFRVGWDVTSKGRYERTTSDDETSRKREDVFRENLQVGGTPRATRGISLS